MIERDNRRRLTGWLMVMTFSTLGVMASPAGAGETTEGWQPPPPELDDFDWVQLTSGEWLKGEIVALYEESLEFDSDKLKVQSLKWKDVRELRSAGVMEIGFEDGGVARGKILVDEETIRFVDEEDRRFPRSEVLSITAGSPREIDSWAMKAGLGVNVRSGNSEQVEATSRVILIRRSPKNRLSLDYLGSFNEIDETTTADTQRATAAWNRYVSRKVFLTPLFGEWFRDPFQNIRTRWTVGAGLGYELIDTARISLKAEVGGSYQETRFENVAEGEAASVSTPGLVLSTAYKQELAGWLDFSFDWRANIVNEESGSYTHHVVTGFEIELTRVLDLDLTLIWDRTENPQEDAGGVVPERDDYRLVTSLSFEF